MEGAESLIARSSQRTSTALDRIQAGGIRSARYRPCQCPVNLIESNAEIEMLSHKMRCRSAWAVLYRIKR